MEQSRDPSERPGYGFALASLIVSIIGLALCLVPGVSLVFGVMAIALGMTGQSVDKRSGADNDSTRKTAAFGVILGVVDCMFGAAGIIYIIGFTKYTPS
ncbi:MAG: hypothetical protein Q7N50_03040 [Armatimonadota bacterium]|nr:hypothetical protein [Armatimonadota bacterium]